MSNSDGHTETITTNTDSVAVDIIGSMHLHLSGTFDTATVTLKFKDSNGAFQPVEGGVFTAATDRDINFPARCRNTVKVTVSSVGGSTSIVVGIQSENR